jgi:hypothetical protein
MNTLMPDTSIAVNMAKQMKPSKEINPGKKPTHRASLRERNSINAESNAVNGDWDTF